MACRLFGTKLFYEPMLVYCNLIRAQGTNISEIWILNYNTAISIYENLFQNVLYTQNVPHFAAIHWDTDAIVVAIIQIIFIISSDGVPEFSIVGYG